MKKSLFYLFMLMAVVAMPLTSCEKNNDPQDEEKHQPGPKAESDQTEITAYDGVEWMQGCILTLDENGEVFTRIYGQPLDESQPDVLSAPVADFAAAEKLFLRWVAPGKTATKVDGGYDYNLTDAAGKAQGSVSFRAVEDGGRVIARMTVAEGTALKHISEFNFVDMNRWPENDYSYKYNVGDIGYMRAYVLTWEWGLLANGLKEAKYINVPYYCIQDNQNGKEGIFVWLSPDADDIYQHPKGGSYGTALKYLATKGAAQPVLDIYNNNPELWKAMLKVMDAEGYMWSPQMTDDATGRSEFMLADILGGDVYGAEFCCLDLDEPVGEIRGVNSWTPYYYRYMQIKFVPPYTGK